jgi:hypothetical protein
MESRACLSVLNSPFVPEVSQTWINIGIFRLISSCSFQGILVKISISQSGFELIVTPQ